MIGCIANVMHVITLIEKQAIDHDMIQAEMNSLSPRPAACSPSNGGLKVQVTDVDEGQHGPINVK